MNGGLTEGWAIAIVTNAIVIIVAAIGASWRMASIKADILEAMNEHSKDDADEFTRVRAEIDDTARSFGESVAAVRQKINDVELYTVQTYVRRDGFYKSLQQVTDSIANMRKEIREDLLRMEGKLDRKADNGVIPH